MTGVRKGERPEGWRAPLPDVRTESAGRGGAYFEAFFGYGGGRKGDLPPEANSHKPLFMCGRIES